MPETMISSRKSKVGNADRWRYRMEGGGVMRCHKPQVQTHARLMWCTARVGALPSECLHRACTLLTCENKLILAWGRQTDCLYGDEDEESLCVSPYLSETPACSGFNPPLPFSPRSFHKIESHMAYCWQGL